MINSTTIQNNTAAEILFYSYKHQRVPMNRFN